MPVPAINPDIAHRVGALLEVLNHVGTFVFAASGALAAAKLRQTLVTFAFFALVTGVGGGTVRDLLIGAPVFWVRDPLVPLVCMAAAVIVWVTPQRWWMAQDGSSRALDWLDAIGLAAFAVFGAAKASAFGVAPLPAAMMGVITGCVGGIIRDVLAGQPSIILRPELYVTAAALAAGLFVLLASIGLSTPVSGALASLAGFGLRAWAIRGGIALPAYRTRD
ncbi:MAG: trimeric intracellular cation channel family protein [Sphingobium sp.]|nr:trimeric intracellular cation channel family protein [Sphingobium sp.]